MCDTDLTFDVHAPIGQRIVELQANEDRLHPEFSRILKAHCRDIAVMLEKENEKGEKI